MRQHPLTLGVVRPIWTVNQKRAFGTVSPEARQAVLARDDYTCQCCGFRAEKYQEILHIDGDDRNFDKDNVLTACIFCHQCFDLASVNTMNSGMLIWLPEISQAKLHHIMRAVYIGRVTQGPLGDMARKIFDGLYARGDAAKKVLGSTDPGALALVLRDFLTKKDYEQAQANMQGLRLLPLDRRMQDDETGGKVNFFPQVLAHWRAKTGPYATIPAQEWAQLFASLAPAGNDAAATPALIP